jgi:WD40 repeat protein
MSASDDCSIRIWDFDNNWAQTCCVEQAHAGAVTLVTWCDCHLLSCGEDQQLRVWQVSSGGKLACTGTHALKQPASAVSSAILRQPGGGQPGGGGGAIAVIGHLSGEVFVWELGKTGGEVGADRQGGDGTDTGKEKHERADRKSSLSSSLTLSNQLFMF